MSNFKDISYDIFKSQHMNNIQAIPMSKDCYDMQAAELWIIDLYKSDCEFNAFMRNQLALHEADPAAHFRKIAIRLYNAETEIKLLKD